MEGNGELLVGLWGLSERPGGLKRVQICCTALPCSCSTSLQISSRRGWLEDVELAGEQRMSQILEGLQD